MKSKREVEELFTNPPTDIPQNKPAVYEPVFSLLFVGILNSTLALFNIDKINNIQNARLSFNTDWLMLVNYAIIVFGILCVVAAALINKYKRIGLYLGGVILAIGLVVGFVISLMSGGNILCGGILNIVALYYIHKYLTHQPEASFFT